MVNHGNPIRSDISTTEKSSLTEQYVADSIGITPPSPNPFVVSSMYVLCILILMDLLPDSFYCSLYTTNLIPIDLHTSPLGLAVRATGGMMCLSCVAAM